MIMRRAFMGALLLCTATPVYTNQYELIDWFERQWMHKLWYRPIEWAENMYPHISQKQIEKEASHYLNSDQLSQLYTELKSTTLLDLLCAGMPTTDYDFFKLMIAYKKEKILTPTEAHCMRYLDKNNMQGYCEELRNNCSFRSFLNRLIAQEKKIIARGNLSFVHAAVPDIVFAMDMYTQGWYIKNNLPNHNDFLFMRFENLTLPDRIRKLKRLIALRMRKKIMAKKINIEYRNQYTHHPMQTIFEQIAQKLDRHAAGNSSCDPIDNCALCIQRKKTVRSLLLKHSSDRLIKASNGLNISSNTAREIIRKNLIFLNSAFFGNINYQYECSAFYFWHNQNCTTQIVKPAFAFKKLGMESYYQTYRKEFEQLAQLHKQIAANKGVIIQLESIPQAARDAIYASGPCGYIKLGPRTLKNRNQTTDDVKKISDIMRTNIANINDADFLQYCYVTTAQEPGNGIRMHRHYYGDQKLVQQYYQKRDALFAKIRANFQAT